MKTHYSSAELAAMKLPGLPGKRRIYDRAIKEGWASRQVPAKGGKGGVRTEYAVASLPKAVREAILQHTIKKLSPAGVNAISPAVSSAATPAAPFYPVAPVDPAHCSARQREEKLARHTVLRKLDELMHASGSSREAAMTTLLTMARAGTLGEALCSTLRLARDARGKKGDEYPSIRSLKRWIAKDKAGDLMPKVAQPDMRILPWHALAISLRRRPQGSSLRWLHGELESQWNAEWGTAPGYHAVCRFFREKFSQLDQLKGRYTGSALRSHKFYQHRTSEGLVPAMEVHADGWNTHFTAPHPVTSEFVTYEVWHFHDVATRFVTPPGLGLTENFEVIAKGLENYIRVFGVPLIVQTDSTKIVRGSARFTKDPVRSIEERVGCTIVHPKEVGNSQANGICENFNMSYLDKRSRELATYQAKDMDTLTFKRVKKLTADMVKAANAGDLALRDQKKREAERMGKGLVFTSHEEAVEWINGICAAYNHRPHRSLPKVRCPESGRMRHQTPAEALQQHRAAGWEPTLMGDTPEAHEAFLVDTFRPRVVVKVTRETVSPYGGMRFRNVEALGHWNGKEVVAVYDIHEWRSVRVEDMKGALICMAEFVAATGYRAVTAYEDAEEKRAKAQIRRREKQIAQIEARTPAAAIEEQSVKTIVDFIDVNPAPAQARELTIADFLPEAKQEEQESSYSDTVMWLYGDKKEAIEGEVAAG